MFVELPFLQFNGIVGGKIRTPRVVDPYEVMSNFYALAQAVNGNLGIENITGGGQVTPGMLQASRSLVPISFTLDTGFGGAWPDPAPLVKMKAACALQAVSVGTQSTSFGSTVNVKNGGTVVCVLASPSINGPPVQSYLQSNITAPLFALGDTLSLSGLVGTISNLCFWFTFPAAT